MGDETQCKVLSLAKGSCNDGKFVSISKDGISKLAYIYNYIIRTYIIAICVVIISIPITYSALYTYIHVIYITYTFCIL